MKSPLFDRSISNRITSYLFHAVIWLLILFFGLLVFADTSSGYKLWEFLLLFSINLSLFYLVSGVISHRSTYLQKGWRLFLILPVIFLLFCLLKVFFVVVLRVNYDFDVKHTFSINSIFNYSFSTGVFMFFAIGYRFIENRIYIKRREKELRNEKNLAELQNLKSQVNPHFLFNTLNNLYFLCLKKDDVAPEMVLKLSELMRYIVSVGSREFVSLSDEIRQITNYVDLEKMRLPNPDYVKIKIEILETDKLISPLLLLPFVENAFKHSKNRITDGITILIKEEDLSLHFHISNYFDLNDDVSRKGTGLENVRRRLNLVYPDLHSLTINMHDQNYSVDLKLPLYANTLHCDR